MGLGTDSRAIPRLVSVAVSVVVVSVVVVSVVVLTAVVAAAVLAVVRVLKALMAKA